ncbi:MAG: hypothetical protein EA428_04680 [Spirochaetaceae bacterium]|nr:MAG: hypothetical protein EA428_04680 [Spirochaetaceae bacterium]
MSKISLVLCFGLTLVVMIPLQLPAQRHSEDPALQKARQETELVLDLGRLIGFLWRMVEDRPDLEISREQAAQLADLLGEIRTTSRLNGAVARSMTARIENDILNPAQLQYSDRLWIESEQNRLAAEPGSGAGARAGAGSGSTPGTGAAAEGGAAPAGSLAAYAAGGPYNPLIDSSRQQSQDVEALFAYVRARAGRR